MNKLLISIAGVTAITVTSIYDCMIYESNPPIYIMIGFGILNVCVITVLGLVGYELWNDG